MGLLLSSTLSMVTVLPDMLLGLTSSQMPLLPKLYWNRSPVARPVPVKVKTTLPVSWLVLASFGVGSEREELTFVKLMSVMPWGATLS